MKRFTKKPLSWLVFYVAAPAMFFQIFGCDRAPTQLSSGPFGESDKSRLLSPFAGAWVFDLEKTLSAQKAAGATQDQLDEARKLYGSDELCVQSLNMTFVDSLAVGTGIPTAEYRFYSMHKHGDKVCGKAWHHEDRFDPGDMSKCYVRMKIENGDLYFEVKMNETFPDPNDPDLVNLPSADAGSAANCQADAPSDGSWSSWTVYVFVRKR